MAEAHDSREILYQNLLDAGIGVREAKKYVSLSEENGKRDLLPFLQDYRSKLTEGIRVDQEKLECLDFLIYRLRK